MITELIRNFIKGNIKKDIPLQIKPLEYYHNILHDIEFNSYGGEDLNHVSTNGDFCYCYINQENILLTISGSLWHGNYKLTKLTKNV